MSEAAFTHLPLRFTLSEPCTPIPFSLSYALLYCFVNRQQRLGVDALWSRAVAAATHAQAVGALQPIATMQHIVEDQGIPFLVRELTGRRQRAAAAPGDPFLPYEPAMFVADISATHVCLLNKFNVIGHHLLVVTRDFEEQTSALNHADFAALWACMAEVDALAFYNAGKVAGASQRHKHLQLAPLPLGPDTLRLPVEQALAVQELDDVVHLRTWPYPHALMRLDPLWLDTPADAAGQLLGRYQALLAALALDRLDAAGLLPPYNLLATRTWMLLVPRTQEESDGIPVNALGFAGSLLVRSAAQLAQLKASGPLAILRHVGRMP